MAKRISVDKPLFTATLLLVFCGLVMVFSASAVMAQERFGSPYTFVIKQVVWAVAGLMAMFVIMNIDYRRYKQPAIIFSLLGLTMLLLVLVLVLDQSHNANRWIRFGSFSFQPSELAKPVIILFLAYFLEKRMKEMDDWRHTLVPAVVPTVCFAILIVKEPDLGTAIACVTITATVLFVAGMKPQYFAYAFAVALVPLYFLIFRVQWRYDRILAFLNPYSDPQGRGFHIIQSLIAVGTGGFNGVGLMEGKQKMFYLPEPHTDFIFAVAAEEFGLIGSLIVLALFAVFLQRGLKTALGARDNYTRLLAVGITAMVIVQALINISVVLALMPTKGLPLPFVSYGGSSLFITLASVGILLSITKHADLSS
jgi:cell division protein FtsW